MGNIKTEVINHPGYYQMANSAAPVNSASLAAVQSLMAKVVPHPYGAGMFPQASQRSILGGGSIEAVNEEGQYAQQIGQVNASRNESYSSDSSTSSTSSVTLYSARPQYQLDSFHDSGTSAPFKYLWSYYIHSTSRFCAIHDFETPFLSSIVPLASKNADLQSALMFLSTVYRNRILGMQDENHEAIASELSVRSMRGLRDKLNMNLTPGMALVGVATCLGLTCCYIGENNSELYNTHLSGGLMIATQVIIPDKRFELSLNAWFLFKWLTYCEVLVNINLLAVPEQLSVAKAHNLPAMEKLYGWWQQHAHEDPEYNLPVDSFYGFGTRLAPFLLQMNILATRDALIGLPGYEHIVPASHQEVNELEAGLWLAHETSVMAKYSSVCLRKTDVDLLHCDASFHGAALLYVYTYLKIDEFSQNERIPHLVLSVIAEVKAISPVCRTAAALLFVMYIAGSHADGEQRTFIYGHLNGMRQTCLSSVDSVLRALTLIWALRDENPLIPVRVCHRKVYEAGINVCVY